MWAIWNKQTGNWVRLSGENHIRTFFTEAEALEHLESANFVIGKQNYSVRKFPG